MTLADILKPSLTVLWHAEMTGMQIGAGLATVASVPLLALRPTLVNAADDPPLVAVAKCAGVGALAGAGVVGTSCIVKLAKLDKDAINDRAKRIGENADLATVNRAAASGAAVGVALVALRIGKVADAEGKSFGSVIASKEGAWEVFCFSALGATVGVFAVTASKKIVEKVKKARESAKEGTAGSEAAEAVGQSVEDAAKATEEKAADVVDSVKDAIVTPAE